MKEAKKGLVINVPGVWKSSMAGAAYSADNIRTGRYDAEYQGKVKNGYQDHQSFPGGS